MKPNLRTLLFFILLLAGSLAAAAQETCMLLPAPLAQRASQAVLVVEGKVIGQQARWDQQHRNIYTANLVEVYQVFKGPVPASGQLEIITEGGSVGNDLQVYSATLSLQTGQQGIFFLEACPFPVVPQFGLSQPVYSVYTSLQGFISYGLPFEEASEPFRTYPSISRDLYPALQALPGLRQQQIRPNGELLRARPRPASGHHPAARTQATPAISSFSPQVITAGTGEVLTISGSNFGSGRGAGFVEFRNANNGGATFIRPQATDYLSWTDDTIRVRVPSAAQGSGVAGSGPIRVTNDAGSTHTTAAVLTVEFAASNVLRDDTVAHQPYHVDKNGQGGYTLSFAAGFPGPARQAFTSAMQQWSCHTAINWIVGEDAPAATAVAEDGINIIRFSPPDQIPGNILGRTTTRYQGCQIYGELRYYVNELDFEFNNSINWQFGPAAPAGLQFDFPSVVLHEQGHAHQLSHLILPRAVMHFSVARGQVSRTLNGRSEVDGGNFVTRRSFRSNLCGPARMTPLVPEACALLAPLLAFQAASQPDGSARLDWSAQQEGRLDGYEVQRSSNGFNWLPVGLVDAGGGQYSFPDPLPFRGITYYRLRLVYADGTPGYSAIRQVGTEAGLTTFIQLYPNPVAQQLSFEYHAPAAGQVVLQILDVAGRQHGRLVRRIAAGNNPFVLDASGLAPGLYVLQTISGQQVHTAKFVKR